MYSTGFREAVLKYYDGGHKYKETCEAFGISQATLFEWLKLREETGSLKSRHHGTKPKIDRATLKKYVDEHPDAFQREIAEEFGCSRTCICQNLKKIGYTLKKRPPVQGTGSKEGGGIHGSHRRHQPGGHRLYRRNGNQPVPVQGALLCTCWQYGHRQNSRQEVYP